ncbi:MAG: hypothetical protein K0S75_839 [Clostridia bacterium]|jgi:hypothetical protein|nr:hypothetical protein [Clostridia bacterium]
MKSSPVISVTVNIIPKYSEDEWNKIWLDWHYEVQSRMEKDKLDIQKKEKAV